MSGIKSIYGGEAGAAGERAGVAKAARDADGFQYVNPPDLFDGSTLFTQLIVAPAGRTVAVSGLIGCGADNILVSDDHEGQIRQAFKNLAAAIRAALIEPHHVIRISEYVVDYSEAHLIVIKEEIQSLFTAEKYPANTLVPVPRLGREGALFEIDAMAVMSD